MIKVFLVEDESIIRNAVKNSIDWEKEGYEFVGEAGDGELAYPLIMKSRPDILITDIRMPFMDGLELSEAIKKELPDIKIIILSGHNDFEYAKRAINIGITDYLLKPISADKLLEAIGSVVVKIEQEREERELLRKYSEEMSENLELEKNMFFTRMLTESMSITEALEQGKSLGVNLSAEYYNVMLFKVMDNGIQPDLGETVVKAWNKVFGYVQLQERAACFQRGVEGLAILCMAESEEEIYKQMEEIRDGIHRIMEEYPQLEYFGGIGSCVTRLRNLKDSFHEAEHAFAGRFTSRINQIIYLRELQGHGDNEEAPSMKGLGTVELNREAISKFLRNGTEEEVDSFVGACFSEMPEDNLRSMMMRQYILMDIYVTVASFGEGMEIEQEEIEKACGDMQGIMDNLSDIQKMKNHACRILKGMVLLRDTVSGHRYSDIIENAQEYILKNYMSENISLNAVAVSVNLSPSYFSSIFSQEVGQTFVEYLTGIRMEKAKELLMCSSKKTSEIGYEVGYKDSHYFSYIFKKTQKCTPKEYRARGKV